MSAKAWRKTTTSSRSTVNSRSSWSRVWCPCHRSRAQPPTTHQGRATVSSRRASSPGCHGDQSSSGGALALRRGAVPLAAPAPSLRFPEASGQRSAESGMTGIALTLAPLGRGSLDRPPREPIPDGSPRVRADGRPSASMDGAIARFGRAGCSGIWLRGRDAARSPAPCRRSADEAGRCRGRMCWTARRRFFSSCHRGRLKLSGP